MKSKVVLGLMAVTGILALSSTMAQAGSGFPSALTSFFVCHPVNGENVGVKVDVYSDEASGATTTPARKNVTIGQAVLACAQALLWPAGTQDPAPGNDIPPFVPGVAASFELKCYSASGGDPVPTQPPTPKKAAKATTMNIRDGLFPGDDELGISIFSSVQLVCGPALITR